MFVANMENNMVTEKLNLSLSKEDKKTIERLAEEEHRKLNQQIVHMTEFYIKYKDKVKWNQCKNTIDYLRFLKYFLTEIYPRMVSIIKVRKNKFINEVISVLNKNILIINKQIHKVNRTVTASVGVLTKGTCTIAIISQFYKNHIFCFNIFGGKNRVLGFFELKSDVKKPLFCFTICYVLTIVMDTFKTYYYINNF